MRRVWEPEDLVAGWTLVEHDERELVAYKRGAPRLAFALMLKFFEIEARFPHHAGELPPAAVDYVARQVGVDPAALDEYGWSGSTVEYHRSQIRRALGFRRFTLDDEAKLAGWLAEEVAPVELSDERLREALLTRCRAERIEPPARADRILGAARAAVSDRFTAAIVNRLSPATVAGLEALAGLGADGQDPASGAWLAELKADPGRVSRDSLRSEIAKLARVRGLALPDGLFDGWSGKLVAAWRARAAAEYPSDLRSHDPAVRLTLLATLAWVRQGEIIDGLVDLLIALVHKIDSRAVQGAQAELLADLHRVRGKENLLFRMAEAALAHPDDTVRNALYPVVAPATLAELVREGRASASALRARTRLRLHASYSSYYRRVIPELLEALQFRSSNTRHAPVIEALALMRRHAGRSNVRFYAADDMVPLDGIVPSDWRTAVLDEREDGTTRVERIPYELCVLAALRESIRRRKVWVLGGVRWRNPDIDLPADFDAHRAGHYERLGQPLDPTEFIDTLRGELSTALSDLDTGIGAGDTGGVSIGTRVGRPWITVPKLTKQPEPANLERLKAAVQTRWGTVDLLDMLTEADHHVGLVDCFPSIATRETTPAGTLRERLLLVLFALGTNTGIKHLAAGGEHGHSEAALRHVRRLHVTKENLRRAITTLVNANYAARDPALWGAGTACASDSKKFGSWESNLMTEWHARYRGPGVMIYWHVEKGRLCVYSQLKSCSSSEVAAMMEGLLHHGTEVPIEANYVDTRFTRPGPQHPTYAALVELGRAVKSVFVARYLRSEALRREINDGLQVVENWNSANGALFYGKDRELTGADRDSQEVSVLALHLLQSALVYVNTLLLQRILADQPIDLTVEDRRALSPLFWTHVRPYGTFQLHLDRHLDLDPHPVSA